MWEGDAQKVYPGAGEARWLEMWEESERDSSCQGRKRCTVSVGVLAAPGSCSGVLCLFLVGARVLLAICLLHLLGAALIHLSRGGSPLLGTGASRDQASSATPEPAHLGRQQQQGSGGWGSLELEPVPTWETWRVFLEVKSEVVTDTHLREWGRQFQTQDRARWKQEMWRPWTAGSPGGLDGSWKQV